MRRFLATLAVGGMVLAPTLTIAKSPFDFSDWVQESRNRAAATENTSAAPAAGQQASPASDSGGIAPRLKNYAGQLFNESATPPENQADAAPPSSPGTWTADRQTPEAAAPSDPFALDTPTDVPTAQRRFTRDDLNSRGSDDSLQRFDEFLKSRTVHHAEFDEAKHGQVGERVQPVADKREQQWQPEGPRSNSRWQLESTGSPHRHLGITEDEAPAEPVDLDAHDGDGDDARFWFVEEKVDSDTPGGNNRLTEAISTSPVGAPRADHPTIQPARVEQNPFAEEAAQVTPASAQEPLPTEAAAPPEERNSRLSITRAAAARPVPSEVAPASPSISTSPITPRASSITAVWNPTAPLNVNQECPCDLVVTNTRKVPADEVTVETLLPRTVRIVDATPAPVEADGALIWSLQTLQPGEERRIRLVIVPDQTGSLELSAAVRSTDLNAQSLTVVQPQLDVSVTGPVEVSVGEPASQTVVVRNPGSGVATNVKLEARVPEGLEHVRGKRLMMDIGSLNPGETRQVRLALAAVAGGRHVLQVEARADSGLIQTASAEVTIAAPQLKASIQGPGLRYLGREAVYTLRVENEGEAPTDAVQMVHRIPDGFDFVRSDRGAQFDSTTRNLVWFVGRLSADQPQDLNVTLVARKAGEFEHAVRAASEHGSYSDARMMTRVEGTPSLVIEVADLDDPVEVGVETAYEVTIINEGTASSHQVALACELPAGITLLRAEGPAEHRVRPNAVEFQPVAEVAAGESLTYRVYVKGVEKGDKRFRCRLTSAHLSQPLFTEEFTKFYGE